MSRNLLILFIITLATPVLADVANDDGRGNTTLFFLEGEQVVRGICRTDTTLYDRSTCGQSLKEVDGKSFYDVVGADFGNQSESWATRIRELYIKIDRLDTKLLELVSVDPTPAQPDLLAQIEAKEQELAATESKIADLQDQIARIKRALSQRESSDLREQLQTLQIELSAATQVQGPQRLELHRLREQYVEANSAVIDAETFQDLQDHRASLLGDISSAKGNLDREMKALASASRAFNMIGDQGFVYEVLGSNSSYPDVRPVVSRFNPEFERLDLALRTTIGEFDHGVVRLRVLRSGEVDSFTCSFTAEPNARCEQLEIHQPNDYRNPLDGLTFYYNQGGTSHGVLRPMLRQDPRGLWEVKPICGMIVLGGGAIHSGECKLILK